MSNLNDKPKKPEHHEWVKRIGQSLDQSLEQLDQPLRQQLARRRRQVLKAAGRQRLLKRSAWLGVAMAACFAFLVIAPVVKVHQAPADELALMQDLELLENLDLLEAMGDELHGT